MEQQIKIRCHYDELLTIGELEKMFHPKNRNKHPHGQLERLAKILEYQGIRKPATVSNQSQKITAGHGRVMAAKIAGVQNYPVVYQDYDNEDMEYADVQADNAIAEWAELQVAQINEDVKDLGPDFDIDNLGLQNFTIDAADKYGDSAERAGNMTEKFGAPPFSVLNARSEWWQERKRMWINMGLASQEGRSDNLLSYSSVSTMDEKDTSIFDPTLCEILYNWFAPDKAHVIDPFAGGSVRGIIAAHLELEYLGIDLRPEQVEANKSQAEKLCGLVQPAWVCDTAENVLQYAQPNTMDMLLTCPPYGDLEKYSDDPKDLSNMPYDQFINTYRQIINHACQTLRENRFAVCVVGEIRDKKTGIYRNFVADTIQAFTDAGMHYYNEMILVTAVGSLPLRAGKTFTATRKIGKTHQNVLVFVKGDGKQATLQLPEPALRKEEVQ